METLGLLFFRDSNTSYYGGMNMKHLLRTIMISAIGLAMTLTGYQVLWFIFNRMI